MPKSFNTGRKKNKYSKAERATLLQGMVMQRGGKVPVFRSTKPEIEHVPVGDQNQVQKAADKRARKAAMRLGK
jgi:hypothetical protein